ncbi:MAG TPA: DUF2061 domain-containing protein [Byssovorax sp.]|jgi:uncharacterized membrane protein
MTRSIVKTASYRVLVMTLDFATVYLLSGKVAVAAGFTLVSNLYTTLAYFLHERLWDRVRWGRAATDRRVG